MFSVNLLASLVVLKPCCWVGEPHAFHARLEDSIRDSALLSSPAPRHHSIARQLSRLDLEASFACILILIGIRMISSVPQTRDHPHERPTPDFGIRDLHRSSYGHGNLMAKKLRSSCSRLVTSKSVSPAAVTLLRNGELDALTLGQRDPWLLLTDDAGKSQ